MKRHLQGSDYSDDSSSDCFVIRHNAKPLTMKHEDDDISSTEAMRKQMKKTTTKKVLVSSSSVASKRNWTQTEELLILRGIVDYQNETKSSYASDWNAVYDRIRDSIESDFSKKQLIDKVYKLKNRRFKAKQARGTGRKVLCFTNDHEEQVFKLSKIIWGEKETNFVYEENLDQKKEYVPCPEQESLKIDNGEKDKDGVDDLCVLQEALVLATSFQSLGNNQRKSLLQNMRNVGAKQRKELEEEWKALLVEEMQLDIEKQKLDIKKQSFYAKLVNAGFSA